MTAERELDGLLNQLDLVDIDDELVRSAAELAEAHALRAYDAVHLAAAARLEADDVVVAVGDRALLTGAHAMGLAVARSPGLVAHAPEHRPRPATNGQAAEPRGSY